jgi:vesicle coat complex subunit
VHAWLYVCVAVLRHVAGGAQVFFCEYNDPIYVKLAKLEVMVRKASAANVELVLSELKECVLHSRGCAP